MKKLLRKIFGSLPLRHRHSLIRRLTRIELNYPQELKFKIASSREELEQAFSILHDAYVSQGFMKPHPSGMRVTFYHALPTTTTLVAKWKDQVIGTVSIVRDGAHGVPLESIFDVSSFRNDGTVIAEISSLAIHPDFRGRKGLVLLGLCKFLYEYCVTFFGTERLVIAVNPKHQDLYEALLLFDKLEEKAVNSYSFVNGAPAVGLTLDLVRAPSEYTKVYWHQPAEKNLYTFFTQVKLLKNFIFPRRAYLKVSDPVMTPELLDYFFRERTQVFANLSAEENEALYLAYGRSEAYRKVLPPAKQGPMVSGSNRRSQARFEAMFEGRLLRPFSFGTVQLRVVDVSYNGFAASSEEPLELNCRYHVDVRIGTFDTLSLEVEAVNVLGHENPKYGFRLVQ